MNEVQLIYSRFRLILPMNHVPPLNFDTFTTIVQGDDYQNKADEFLKCIQFDKLSKRDLISLIIIANYPDVVADSSGIDNKLLIDKCVSFFNDFIDIDEDTNMDEHLKPIKANIEEITEIYLTWKNQDLNKKLEFFINSYYELEQMRLNLSIYKEDEEILPNLHKIHQEQDKLKEYIQKISGNYGLKLLQERSPVYINVEQFKQVATKAFWDTFKEKLDQEDPDYTRLIIMVKEIKQLFYSVIPNNAKVQNEIHEYIDTDLLLQKLEAKAIKFDDIYAIMEYIVQLLQRFQSPVQDKPTEEWWNGIKEMMKPNTTYGQLITEFFQGVFERIEKIKEEISIFKENSQT